MVPMASKAASTVIVRTVSANAEEPDPVAPQVVRYTSELETLWERHQVPPGEVYGALRGVVLPAARPTEIFLYASSSMTQGAGVAARVRGLLTGPTGVGFLLARWAVRAGHADDLRRRIEERKVNPGARPAADVLLSQLAATEGKAAAVTEEKIP